MEKHKHQPREDKKKTERTKYLFLVPRLYILDLQTYRTLLVPTLLVSALLYLSIYSDDSDNSDSYQPNVRDSVVATDEKFAQWFNSPDSSASQTTSSAPSPRQTPFNTVQHRSTPSASQFLAPPPVNSIHLLHLHTHP